ncbi:OmpA family protein [Roseicyclus sp. F158]|uniref:OmpA family protein n=1 Tax=Tropicimonas omnivorans TaxID=3075590 RepID=A0ABU3DG99_9RHOB|nr:OmpA family protein [Roseicyclus sp. F158]MDT0682751.1 OmpA family protein [Roseicyclus sp. F158]
MGKKTLRTTTALVASISLVAPTAPLYAQDALADAVGAEMCEDGEQLIVPEADAEGLAGEIEMPTCFTEEELIEAGEIDDPDAETEAETEAEVDAETDMSGEADAETDEAMTEGETDMSATAETTAETDAEADPMADTMDEAMDETAETAGEVADETDEVAEEAASEMEDAATETAESVDDMSDETAETMDDMSDEVAEESESAAEQLLDNADSSETEAEADTEAETETDSDLGSAIAAETDAQSSEDTDMTDAEMSDDDGETEATAENDGETATTAEADADTTDEDTDTASDTEFTNEEDSLAALLDEPELDEESQEIVENIGTDRAEDGSSTSAAVQAEESGEADAEDESVEVTEETVTEADSRSSAEEFINQLTTNARNNDDDDDDDGLTTGQKAAIGVLGALAVGAVLSNNRRVVANSGDRVVVERQDGSYDVLKDDNALLRQPGNEVQTRTYDDGSSRQIVTRPDGTQIVTLRDSQLRVLRRTKVFPDGEQVVLFDDTGSVQQVNVQTLPENQQPVFNFADNSTSDEAALRRALSTQVNTDRSYALYQVRDIRQVRELAPAIDVEAITFASGSSAISPDEARTLVQLGRAISDTIADNPREIFLVEGHTDAVGNAAYNLGLSDRRAESVALALTEYFDVPPENLVTQGYGEQFLKVETLSAEPANRRATVRRITPLLQQTASVR